MAKLFWILIVVAGFLGAGFLIGNSYHEWLESPILTTITTHPLDDLDFPAVTVCPPQGSNTALNFDLMQMNNSKGSFSEQQQKKLRDVIRESLVEKPHQDFAKRMLAVTQKANLRKTFEGHFSVAKPYGESGEKLRLWDTNGTIESENFKGNFSESSYKTDRDVHVVLELPDHLEEQVGSDGSLVIELEADIRQAEGWTEYLQYSNVTPSYTFDWHSVKAVEAQAKCQNKGGHLVLHYATSEDEKDEIKSQAPAAPHSRLKRSYWGYANNVANKAKNELSIVTYRFLAISGYLVIGTGDVSLSKGGYYKSWAYICRITKHHIEGKMQNKMELSRKQLTPIFKFQVWYRYEVAEQKLLNSWKEKRMTGFRITWFIKNGSNVREAKPNHVDQNLRNMVILATEARKANMSSTETILTAIGQKQNISEEGEFNRSCYCERITGSRQSLHQLFDSIDLNLNKTADSTTSEDSITEEDIETGLKIYYATLFCNKEAAELKSFLENLISTESPRTLLLAIVNTLQSENVSWRNRVFLGDIFRAVEKMFDLQLGKILIALSTSSQLTSVMDQDLPYLSKYEKPLKQCLKGGNCQEVRTLIGSIGKNPTEESI